MLNKILLVAEYKQRKKQAAQHDECISFRSTVCGDAVLFANRHLTSWWPTCTQT